MGKWKARQISRVGQPQSYRVLFSRRREGQDEWSLDTTGQKIPSKQSKAEEDKLMSVHQDKDETKENYLPVNLWQKYASPVWYDINYSDTLQYRSARDNKDEKHICPLQLETIRRCLHLWSNEGETVISPFGGIGSEGFESIKLNRKPILIELKESYFNQWQKNLKAAWEMKNQLTLF